MGTVHVGMEFNLADDPSRAALCLHVPQGGGKTKILFPIYFEQERPPTAGVPEGVIEREQVAAVLVDFVIPHTSRTHMHAHTHTHTHTRTHTLHAHTHALIHTHTHTHSSPLPHYLQLPPIPPLTSS